MLKASTVGWNAVAWVKKEDGKARCIEVASWYRDHAMTPAMPYLDSVPGILHEFRG